MGPLRRLGARVARALRRALSPPSPPSRAIRLAALGLLTAALPIGAAGAEDWPSWRGPHGDATAAAADPPLRWSESLNVRFKVALPGAGLASPIVVGERLFLLAAEPLDAGADAATRLAAQQLLDAGAWPPRVEPVAQRFSVLAYSTRDGSLLWRRTAREAVPPGGHYLDSSFACASPLSDGERLYVHFGSNGTSAWSLEGERLWEVDLGDMQTRYGHGEGSSPVLHGELLIVNWDHEGESFLVALDKRTGAERWRRARPGEGTSWSTPLVVETPAGPQLIVSATGRSRGYDLASGEELWSLGGMTVNAIPTPSHGGGLVFLASGYRGNAVQAVDLRHAAGELVGPPAIAWSRERDAPYVPSPLLYRGQLYYLKHNKGILTSVDARSGELLFSERLKGLDNVYASPVAAAGRVYLLSREGQALVLRHGPRLDVLALNSLDDGFDASPALVGRDLYLRGRRFLYALRDAGADPP